MNQMFKLVFGLIVLISGANYLKAAAPGTPRDRAKSAWKTGTTKEHAKAVIAIFNDYANKKQFQAAQEVMLFMSEKKQHKTAAAMQEKLDALISALPGVKKPERESKEEEAETKRGSASGKKAPPAKTAPGANWEKTINLFKEDFVPKIEELIREEEGQAYYLTNTLRNQFEEFKQSFPSVHKDVITHWEAIIADLEERTKDLDPDQL
jgi:hypothetical protein